MRNALFKQISFCQVVTSIWPKLPMIVIKSIRDGTHHVVFQQFREVVFGKLLTNIEMNRDLLCWVFISIRQKE